MSTIKSFEDLTVWQDAREFTNKIYMLTKKFPKEEFHETYKQSTNLGKQVNGLIKYLRTKGRTNFK